MLASPDHHPTTKAHESVPHIDDVRIPPRPNRQLEWVTHVVPGDAGAKEPANSKPGPTCEPAGHGQNEPCVQPPPCPPKPAGWDVELQARHRCIRLEHTAQLSERAGWILDVAQQIGE